MLYRGFPHAVTGFVHSLCPALSQFADMFRMIYFMPQGTPQRFTRTPDLPVQANYLVRPDFTV